MPRTKLPPHLIDFQGAKRCLGRFDGIATADRAFQSCYSSLGTDKLASVRELAFIACASPTWQSEREQ